MYKTVFSVRHTEDGPIIDSCMSVEWPEFLTNDTITTLAEVRKVPPAAMLEMAVSPDVLKFLRDYSMLEMRARINMLSGPYYVNTEEKPSDAFLLAYYEQIKRNRKRRTTKEK